VAAIDADLALGTKGTGAAIIHRLAVPAPKAFRFRLSIGIAAVSIMLGTARAQTLPERPMLSLRQLDYLDWQKDAQRVAVSTRALYLQLPWERDPSTPSWVGDWSLDVTRTVDAISGASPLYHTQALRKFSDRRNAFDMKLTRFDDRSRITLGTAKSMESDFDSKAYSLLAAYDFNERNSSLTGGVSKTSDDIASSRTERSKRETTDLLLGFTQVMSRVDLIQAFVTVANAEGYLSDPYKLIDQRPSERTAKTALIRWNHFNVSNNGSFRYSYRYYTDSYGIRSHTLQSEYAQPLFGVFEQFTITPSLRLYTQSAADFYYGPRNAPQPTIPPGLGPQTIISLDQRLSAFGARTLGLQLTWFGGPRSRPDYRVDLKWEDYEQRGVWSYGFSPSMQALPHLIPFRARWLQLGLTTWY